MKQKWKRFLAGFLAILTMFSAMFTNGTTAFAASASAKISFWNASTKASGEASELKAGYNHGKVLYAMIDGHTGYCMNFGLMTAPFSFLYYTSGCAKIELSVNAAALAGRFQASKRRRSEEYDRDDNKLREYETE